MLSTLATPTMPATPLQPSPLRLLENTPDPDLHAFLTAMGGPVEGIELSPCYFYNWSNWSND